MTSFNLKNFGLRTLIILWLGCTITIILNSWLFIGIASAHADRLVAGKYGFRVGLLDEPAYQNLPNGIDLSLCMGACKVLLDGSGNYSNPITQDDVYQTLKAEVIYGPSKMSLDLTPVFRRPGKFSATFVPTAIGNYSLHFFGTVGSDKIDETFDPVRDGFDAVQDIKVIQFPNKIGVGGTGGDTEAIPAPTIVAATTAPVTTRNSTSSNSTTTTDTTATAVTPPATNETTSDIQSQLASSNQQVQAARLEVAEAKNSASAATTFAIIGIIVGLVGVIVAVLAILRSRGTPVEAG